MWKIFILLQFTFAHHFLRRNASFQVRMTFIDMDYLETVTPVIKDQFIAFSAFDYKHQ